MKLIDHTELRNFVADVVRAAGSKGDEPQLVADNLVEANLAGHDSHGVGMLPTYMEAVLSGELLPNQHAEVVTDHGAMVVIDGHQGYGQVIGREAMEIGIAHARDNGVCVVATRNSFHLCRIGAWGEQCAAAGLVSMHHVNVYGHTGLVAPFRGTDARYATNPYCCVLPATDNHPPVIADFATSVVAMGKVRVSRNKGEQMADGILYDGEGKPTNDPEAMFEEPGGAIRSFGEHKGYCMALVNELLAGVVTGGETCRPQSMKPNRSIINNMLSTIIDPGRLVAGDRYNREIDQMLDYVTASPPEKADEPVLIPGDPERASRKERRAKGIPIDDETWRELEGAARSVGAQV